MGLPSINIVFQTVADNSIKMSQKGVVGMILQDPIVEGAFTITKVSDMDTRFSEENKLYIERAFTGYINQPRSLVIYAIKVTAEPEEQFPSLKAGLDYMATQQIDYLVGPYTTNETQATEIKTWILERRKENATPKAVLPKLAADSEAIINFSTDSITVGEKIYQANAFCSRIAGLIAGTPMTISCTYAPLTEVSDIERKNKSDMDTAIDNGEFILMHDGKKVKVARGVTSLKTIGEGKNEIFKKIKIVEALDMIRYDLATTIEDTYIGKFANSYDNKCLLLTAIKGYFLEMEAAGILQEGTSSVEIDLDAQTAFLKEKGTNVDEMDEQEIREADTEDKVYLKATVKVLDAIEEVSLNVAV